VDHVLKVVAAVGHMQFVYQGKIVLNDAEQVQRICPEPKDLKVFGEGWL
jgi:hypothetical protein